MKRRLLILLLLLVAGAIVNVAVAWGCALWSPIGRVVGFGAPDTSDELWWQSHRPEVAAMHPLALWIDRGTGCEYRMSVGDREGLARLLVNNGSRTVTFPGNSLKDCKVTARCGAHAIDGR